jgi:hypothetical protein
MAWQVNLQCSIFVSDNKSALRAILSRAFEIYVAPFIELSLNPCYCEIQTYDGGDQPSGLPSNVNSGFEPTD